MNLYVFKALDLKAGKLLKKFIVTAVDKLQIYCTHCICERFWYFKYIRHHNYNKAQPVINYKITTIVTVYTCKAYMLLCIYSNNYVIILQPLLNHFQWFKQFDFMFCNKHSYSSLFFVTTILKNILYQVCNIMFFCLMYA